MRSVPLPSGLKSKRAKNAASDEIRVRNANALLRLVHESSLNMLRLPLVGAMPVEFV